VGQLAHPVKIRGHHLLCLLGFRGRGYSPEFVEAMGQVLREFQTSPETPILLVAECDLICASCPHVSGNECRKSPDASKRIRDKDDAIIKKAGLRPGRQTTPQAAWQAIKENFKTQDIAALCSRCQWLELGYCQEGLEKLINGAANPKPKPFR
jgi:hypothetical protein